MVGPEWEKWFARIHEKFRVDPWHLVGATGEPGFLNSWANAGGSDSVAAFRISPFGVVSLKGLVDTGSAGTVIFTLPTDYRPSETMRWPGGGDGTYSRVQVQTDGDVLAQTGTNICLDAIHFYVGGA